jgi:hypothetical protein
LLSSLAPLSARNLATMPWSPRTASCGFQRAGAGASSSASSARRPQQQVRRVCGPAAAACPGCGWGPAFQAGVAAAAALPGSPPDSSSQVWGRAARGGAHLQGRALEAVDAVDVDLAVLHEPLHDGVGALGGGQVAAEGQSMHGDGQRREPGGGPRGRQYRCDGPLSPSARAAAGRRRSGGGRARQLLPRSASRARAHRGVRLS